MDPFLVLIIGVVGALCAAAIVLSGRRSIFWLGFLVTLVPIAYIDRYHIDLPSIIRWAPELGVVTAGAAAMFLVPERRAAIPRAFLIIYGLILAQACASWALNGGSLAALIVSQRGYVLFFATLVSFKAVYDVYGKDDVFRFLTGGICVSGLANILQRLTIAPGQADRVTGLFSLGEVMTFFHLLGIGMVVVYALEGRRLLGCHPLWPVGLLVASLAVSNQEAAIPYLGILFAYFLVRTKRHRGALLGAGAAMGVVMFAVFAFLWDSDYSGEDEKSFSDSILDVNYIARYVFGEDTVETTPSGDLLRGVAVRYAYREANVDGMHLMLGRGPGETSDSSIAGASGGLADAFPGIGRVTLALVLGETGLSGVLFYAAFLLAFAYVDRRGETREQGLVRELFVLFSFAFLVYGRMCYEPSYAWAGAAMLYVGRPADHPRLTVSNGSG